MEAESAPEVPRSVADAKEAATTAASVAAAAASSKLDAVKGKAMGAIKKITGTGKGFIIFMLVAGTVVAFFIAVLLYFAVYKTIAVSETYTIPGSDVPILGTQLTTLTGSNVPNMTNGKRITVSWWIYINDLITNGGRIRRIFSRGDNAAGATGSSPYVALDPTTNRVHVVFRTTDTTQYMNNGVDMSTVSMSPSEKINFLSQKHGIRFDYVPMQRWVHLAVVVDEEANGGTVIGYLDGELVKTVISSVQLDSMTNPITLAGTPLTPVYLEIQNLDLGATGNINVGGDGTSDVGFSGLVSTICFTNTDLNANDIYSQYTKGPTSYASRLGLPSYSVQSPIYRIS